MHYAEPRQQHSGPLTGFVLALVLAQLLVLGGCRSTSPSPPVQAPQSAPKPGADANAAARGPNNVQPQPQASAPVRLAPPVAPRTHEALRLQAAKRLVAANPQGSYMGEVPDVLLAIPVLDVELNRDGSVKHIAVRRYPGQALDTVDLAKAAVLRAAPYGDLSALPKPWVFTEVFLFNNERRFKPRTLDD
ncbi:hypothetical protein ACG0Z6_08090 [Roseateles sp. BYS180W]|uniref:TonB C-terminal domain-containing protein n=1 Tax=Roseateles rivi TaxID=3299028 RepID=A0ABW7FV63_9BURK